MGMKGFGEPWLLVKVKETSLWMKILFPSKEMPAVILYCGYFLFRKL